MIFYIKIKSDSNFDSTLSTNQLGEISFNKFWPQDGFEILKNRILNEDEEWLSQIEIFNDKLEYFKIEQFIDKLNNFHIA